MEVFKAFLFGVIEGITEWLPVSSTGHMIVLDQFLKLSMPEAFKEMFLVVIQLGAIMAVVVLYWKEIIPFTGNKSGWIKKDKIEMWLKILTACIPAVFLELLFGDRFEAVFYNYQTVAIMLITVGILFILLENKNRGKKAAVSTMGELTYQTAFWIGIFQLAAAVLPGTSRSGATILGGLSLGLSRTVAAEFTFYLAIPVMAGAGLMKLLQFGLSYSVLELEVLAVGMLTSFFVSVLVIRFFINYIKKHDFKVFGWYRILLGIFVLFYFLILDSGTTG